MATSLTKALAPVPAEAQQAFKARADEIIRVVVARSLEHADQVAGHGDQAERLLTAGMRYTTLALQTAIFLNNTALLDEQLTWAAERLPHDGVLPEHMLTRLEIYAEVVDSLLPAEQARAITPYVRWMVARQRELMAPAA